MRLHYCVQMLLENSMSTDTTVKKIANHIEWEEVTCKYQYPQLSRDAQQICIVI